MTRSKQRVHALKILLITGKLAEESVKRYASEAEADIDVLALPVPVAAFISPEYAAQAIKKTGIKDYDLIMMPGYVQGDVTPVEEVTGMKTFKGPVHSADIPTVIGLLDDVTLSKTKPASELLEGVLKSKILREIEEVERNQLRIIGERGGIIIGRGESGVPIGHGFPMRVIAEIVNAPTLGLGEIHRLSKYYESSGADVIDIGMLAGKSQPDIIEDIMEELRSSTDLPISIDTLDPSEIIAASRAEVDLVLSVDSGNMEEVADYVSEIPVVVLPSNIRDGIMPRSAEDSVAALQKNIEDAKALGLKKIIADPILEPVINPGLFESLRSYHLYRQADKETPVLFGMGNVTELIDADSQGVNGILAAIAHELKANLLFVPEFSQKARGSVREAATASKMMFLADRRQTVPKDLGIDLLMFKEKRKSEEPYRRDAEKSVTVVKADEKNMLEMDVKGFFSVEIDRENDLIAAIHYPNQSKNADLIIKGSNAKEIYKTAIREKLIGNFDHAAYLGRELEKAEIALRMGRSYVQDEELFP